MTFFANVPKEEFDLSEKIEELNLQATKSEISFIAYVVLRNGLDKEFIRRDWELFLLYEHNKISFLELIKAREKLVGEKLS